MDKLETLKHFAKRLDLRMKAVKIPSRPDGLGEDFDEGATHYLITLYKGDNPGNCKPITIFYSQGSAIKSKPEIDDILNCLAMDTLNIDQSFSDWCNEYGHSDDSMKAHSIYTACKNTEKQMKQLFTLVELTELYNCETL